MKSRFQDQTALLVQNLNHALAGLWQFICQKGWRRPKSINWIFISISCWLEECQKGGFLLTAFKLPKMANWWTMSNSNYLACLTCNRFGIFMDVTSWHWYVLVTSRWNPSESPRFIKLSVTCSTHRASIGKAKMARSSQTLSLRSWF